MFLQGYRPIGEVISTGDNGEQIYTYFVSNEVKGKTFEFNCDEAERLTMPKKEFVNPPLEQIKPLTEFSSEEWFMEWLIMNLNEDDLLSVENNFYKPSEDVDTKIYVIG